MILRVQNLKKNAAVVHVFVLEDVIGNQKQSPQLKMKGSQKMKMIFKNNKKKFILKIKNTDKNQIKLKKNLKSFYFN